MSICRNLLIFATLCSWIANGVSQQAFAQGDVEQLEQQALYEAADAVSKFIVRIETVGGLEKVGRVLVNQGPTSGVVVGADGYIISSAFNFIQDPASIMVKLPTGKRKAAKIISRDKSRRLVLLKIEVDEPLDAAKPSTDEVRVGQWAVAVGRTLPGDGFNMSVGIVSATNRIWGKAIQTDANVSPANYGGALADIHGNIVGVLVPMSPDSASDVAGTEWYDSGIGFCVPLASIMKDLDRMKESDLYSGKLGISLKGSDLYAGELIIGVCRPKSPAREAGMKAGDKIVSINGVAVRTQSEMKHVLGALLAGDTANVKYERDGETLSSDITLTDKLIPYEHPFLGILPVREQSEIEPAGVQIRHIFAESPAAKAELKTDDIVDTFNETAIADAASLREAIGGVEPGDKVELKITRGDDDARTVSVTVGSLPETISKQLPTAFPEVEEANEDLPQLGKMNIKLPEEEGECVAYVPENYDPRFQHSMLVLLPVPGKQKPDELVKQWKASCEEHHTILLLPQAKEKVSWLPTEVAFIRKTIENVRKNYQLDPERIAIMGTGNSGSMAFLTAFTHRDLIRGVIAVDAGIPSRSPSFFNEPLQRLSFVLMGPKEGRTAKRLEANAKLLREMKFPVVVEQSKLLSALAAVDEKDGAADAVKQLLQDQTKLLRWLDSLDRI